MFLLKIVCWAYLIFLLMGRVVNYDNAKDGHANAARFIDNLFMAVFAIFIYFLSK